MLGLDEACIMADAGRNIRIIGAYDRKKHKIFLQTGECRCMYIISEFVYIIYVIWKPWYSRYTSHVCLIYHISDFF